jgi:beta-lactamase superfamily II metal-dependent hydrolase
MMRKTKRIRTLFLVLLCGVSLSGLSQLKVGDQLPLWKEGYLDIHHINTGKGECAFLMLPDGTTMLVDAGATARPKPRVTDPKPDGSRTPGEWISRYIQHFLQNRPEKKLDYILLTHFHDDHIGETYSGLKTSETGNFILSGVTEVGEIIPFDKIVDRNWPSYDYPKPLGTGYIDNYIRFVKWNVEHKGVQAEQFRVGANDQFSLVHHPEKYPEFEIRNLASNGQVWTGVGNNVRNHFPPLASLPENQYPGENACSNAFRLSYGKFDYFNGGDLTTGAPGSWQDIETPVGLVTGPVDVCIANHHAYYDAMGALFMQAVRPRVHIIQVWAPSHPSPSVLARMMSNWTYPGPRDVFATNTMEETRVVSGRMDDLKSQQGHIVVRVSQGGDNYMIYILDDSAENFKVTGIHGPYHCE